MGTLSCAAAVGADQFLSCGGGVLYSRLFESSRPIGRMDQIVSVSILFTFYFSVSTSPCVPNDPFHLFSVFYFDSILFLELGKFE